MAQTFAEVVGEFRVSRRQLNNLEAQVAVLRAQLVALPAQIQALEAQMGTINQQLYSTMKSMAELA